MKAKKILKATMWVLVGLVSLIVLAVLALPLWIGPTVCGIANWQTPKITGCEYNLGKFALSQYTGKMVVGDMQLANPPGYGTGNCVELDNFSVDVGMTTLLSKKVHVEEVVLDGLVISTTVTGSNFRKILANVKGEKAPEEKEDKRSLLERLGDSDKTEEPSPEAEPKPEAKEPGEAKRFVIDKVVLSNIKVNLGYMPIALPTITLEGIGADEPEGASAAEVWKDIYNAIMEKLGAALGAIGDLGKDAAGLIGKGAEAAAGAVSDGANAIKGAVSDGANAITGAVGDGASAAADAIGDGAGAAVNAIGDGAGATADAIGDGAKKTVNAIKGIFGTEK